MTQTLDHEIMKMALLGYEERRKQLWRFISEIDTQVTKIRKSLGQNATEIINAVPKKHVSAAGKAAIAKAQRARWAAYNKAKAKKVNSIGYGFLPVKAKAKKAQKAA